MSNFSAGFRIQPDFIASGIVLAPFICYEIAYPSLVVDYMPKAGLLVTVSDDSWFDRSIALAQQLEIARMRSLEVGRYQAVTSNTGFTAIIDARGRVIADVPPFDEYILTGSVVPMSGSTPFVHLMRIFNSIF
jgi:apolipoprotein N-acyltransferase